MTISNQQWVMLPLSASTFAGGLPLHRFICPSTWHFMWAFIPQKSSTGQNFKIFLFVEKAINGSPPLFPCLPHISEVAIVILFIFFSINGDSLIQNSPQLSTAYFQYLLGNLRSFKKKKQFSFVSMYVSIFSCICCNTLCPFKRHSSLIKHYPYLSSKWLIISILITTLILSTKFQQMLHWLSVTFCLFLTLLTFFNSTHSFYFIHSHSILLPL